MDLRAIFLVYYVFGVSFLCSCPGVAQVTDPSGDAKSGPQSSNIKRVLDKIFKDQEYDKDIRPITHHSNTTVVQFSIAPRYIVDLIEDRSLLWMDSWLVLHWNDFRLTWNPDEFENLQYTSIADHRIWQPDVLIYNSYSWNVDPKMNTHLILWHNGDVWFVPPAVTTTYCPMDKKIGTYPYDTIECDIQFGSWSHDGWQIDLTVMNDGEIYLDEFIDTNPRWDFLENQVKISREVKVYNCCEEPYVSIVVKVPLTRRYPAELKVTWSPCVLVMALTLSMFWIRPDSGKKLILGPILLLILSIMMVYVAYATRSPVSPLIAVSFLGSTLYAVAAAVLLEVVVINISSITGPTRPPEIIVNFLSGPLGRNIAIYARWLDGTAGDKIQLKEDSEQVISHPSAKDEWMMVGAVIDRILFVVFVVVFVAIHRV